MHIFERVNRRSDLILIFDKLKVGDTYEILKTEQEYSLIKIDGKPGILPFKSNLVIYIGHIKPDVT